MYIIKNALRNIVRSKGRNILIGCIAFVIGLSACLALSIKQAAVSEKESGLANLNVTATIGYDRQGMMEKAQESSSTTEEGEKPDFKSMMKEMSSLSLDEMLTYAKADSVKDFYYTMSLSLDGKDIDPFETSKSSSTTDEEAAPSMGQGGRGGMQNMQSQGDFTITGYSSYEAMSDFVSKTKTITSGELFDETSKELTCIINQELATLNDLKVNDDITVVNPENEKDTYKIKVVGIYTSSETTQTQGGPMNMAMSDPANQIYMSYAALNTITTTSNKVSEDTALSGQTRGTYTFASVSDYEKFETQARKLGLSDEYSVSSTDINAYEQSLAPLENLSTYATYFLAVILVIGGCILVVLNIYHIRERKYEIGVLAAIGMNKTKVASQFIAEIFTITMLSVLLGNGIGAAVSVPVTNALISTQSTQSSTMEGIPSRGNESGTKPSGDKGSGMFGNVETIEEVRSATNLNVVLQLVGIAILLTILSGGISVLTILRYEPIRILSEREG